MKQKLFLPTLLLCISVSLSAQTEYKMPRLRISTSGGLGYLIASGQKDISGVVNNDAINKANRDLRLATNLNGDAYYLFEAGWGPGIKYLFQRTSGEANNVIVDINDDAHYMVTDIWEKDYINFVGPSLFGYSPVGSSNNLFLTSSLSVGYAWLRSEVSALNQNVLVTGGNFGMNAEMGLDYLFTPRFGIGVNLGYLMSYFSKVKMTNGINTQEQTLDKDSHYNASNIHSSVGLRYYINR
ncbi:MAG TPA: hypothetical protein PKC47_06635 [Petrimonas sp.]|jgi:hypothetical protein|nr:hypothetical protein [Porphyromonadaceae bacterium]HMM17194.1 hypothetical protein [Petrimonas sp.]